MEKAELLKDEKAGNEEKTETAKSGKGTAEEMKEVEQKLTIESEKRIRKHSELSNLVENVQFQYQQNHENYEHHED